MTEAIWLALQGEGPETLRREITTRYGYDLGQSLEAIRPSHRFDVTCQATVPTALICALESTSLEDAARNAVSLGGDTDTLAAIAGAVSEALHGLPERLVRIARAHYLEHAEDITAALDALYRHAKGDATASRPATVPEEVRGRAQGCLLGQLAGDSLGSLVEFKDASTIRTLYPDGVRELADGGVWDTLAGQPTDDSEMALALGRSLIRNGAFSLNDIRAAYVRWYESEPFDIRKRDAMRTHRPTNDREPGKRRADAHQPARHLRLEVEARSAREARRGRCGAHAPPNRICQQVNGLYAAAIAAAVREGDGPQTLYERILGWAIEWNVDHEIAERIKLAQTHRPPEYNRQMGWVLTAFQNALYELLHAQKLEEGVIATVHCGGDTDTNAAICGALLGAVYGRSAVPQQWVDSMVTCRPGAQNASRPRPTEYWPHDALGLAERLVEAGATGEAR